MNDDNIKRFLTNEEYDQWFASALKRIDRSNVAKTTVILTPKFMVGEVKTSSPESRAHMERAVKLPWEFKKKRFRVVWSPRLYDLPKWISYSHNLYGGGHIYYHYKRIWWRVYVRRKDRPHNGRSSFTE